MLNPSFDMRHALPTPDGGGGGKGGGFGGDAPEGADALAPPQGKRPHRETVGTRMSAMLREMTNMSRKQSKVGHDVRRGNAFQAVTAVLMLVFVGCAVGIGFGVVYAAIEYTKEVRATEGGTLVSATNASQPMAAAVYKMEVDLRELMAAHKVVEDSVVEELFANLETVVYRDAYGAKTLSVEGFQFDDGKTEAYIYAGPATYRVDAATVTELSDKLPVSDEEEESMRVCSSIRAALVVKAMERQLQEDRNANATPDAGAEDAALPDDASNWNDPDEAPAALKDVVASAVLATGAGPDENTVPADEIRADAGLYEFSQHDRVVLAAAGCLEEDAGDDEDEDDGSGADTTGTGGTLYGVFVGTHAKLARGVAKPGQGVVPALDAQALDGGRVDGKLVIFEEKLTATTTTEPTSMATTAEEVNARRRLLQTRPTEGPRTTQVYADASSSGSVFDNGANRDITLPTNLGVEDVEAPLGNPPVPGTAFDPRAGVQSQQAYSMSHSQQIGLNLRRDQSKAEGDADVEVYEDLRVQGKKPNRIPTRLTLVKVRNPHGNVKAMTGHEQCHDVWRVSDMVEEKKCMVGVNGGGWTNYAHTIEMMGALDELLNEYWELEYNWILDYMFYQDQTADDKKDYHQGWLKNGLKKLPNSNEKYESVRVELEFFAGVRGTTFGYDDTVPADVLYDTISLMQNITNNATTNLQGWNGMSNAAKKTAFELAYKNWVLQEAISQLSRTMRHGELRWGVPGCYTESCDGTGGPGTWVQAYFYGQLKYGVPAAKSKGMRWGATYMTGSAVFQWAANAYAGLKGSTKVYPGGWILGDTMRYGYPVCTRGTLTNPDDPPMYNESMPLASNSRMVTGLTEGKLTFGPHTNGEIADFDRGAVPVMGSGYIVINGKHAVSWKSDDLTARSALGVTKDGELLFITIDGHSHFPQDDMTEGVTQWELANAMVRMGAKFAVNLDGGGSSTIAVKRSSGVDVLNHPSSCYSHANRDWDKLTKPDPVRPQENYDQPGFGFVVTRKDCERKVASAYCIGDYSVNSGNTVPKPAYKTNSKCDSNILEKHMDGFQKRVCRMEGNFDNRLSDAYEKAEEMLQVFRANGWIDCTPGEQDPDVAKLASNDYARSKYSCAGTGDWQDALWSMMVTAFVASEEFGHEKTLLTSTADALAAAKQRTLEYMDAGVHPIVYGWDPARPVQCPHEQGEWCETAAATHHNHRVGIDVYEEARALYADTCNWRGKCDEPTLEHLGYLAFLRACETGFSKNIHWTNAAKADRPLRWRNPAPRQNACSAAQAYVQQVYGGGGSGGGGSGGGGSGGGSGGGASSSSGTTVALPGTTTVVSALKIGTGAAAACSALASMPAGTVAQRLDRIDTAELCINSLALRNGGNALFQQSTNKGTNALRGGLNNQNLGLPRNDFAGATNRLRWMVTRVTPSVTWPAFFASTPNLAGLSFGSSLGVAFKAQIKYFKKFRLTIFSPIKWHRIFTWKPNVAASVELKQLSMCYNLCVPSSWGMVGTEGMALSAVTFDASKVPAAWSAVQGEGAQPWWWHKTAVGCKMNKINSCGNPSSPYLQVFDGAVDLDSVSVQLAQPGNYFRQLIGNLVGWLVSKPANVLKGKLAPLVDHLTAKGLEQLKPRGNFAFSNGDALQVQRALVVYKKDVCGLYVRGKRGSLPLHVRSTVNFAVFCAGFSRGGGGGGVSSSSSSQGGGGGGAGNNMA